MLLDEALNPVAGGFFVTGQDDYQIAVRDEPLALVPDEVCHQHGGASLVVARAPAVVIALVLAEAERVERPVLPPRAYHIYVGHQENRLPDSAPPVPGDQIGDPRRGLDQLEVIAGKACLGQPIGHRLGGKIGVPGGVAGVNLDQLLQDVSFERSLIGGLRQERERGAEERGGEAKSNTHGYSHYWMWATHQN
jgi:hypothetical protein